MNIPRQASTRFLAAPALLCLFAALPLTTAAQTAAAKEKAPTGKIVFQSTQGSDGYVNDIYVMDSDGKRQTRLTDDPADDTTPVWSPDGSKIAFLSNRRSNGFELYLMDADGGNQRPLRDEAPIVPFNFQWSPDGTRLSYSDGFDVYVVEVAGTAAPVNVSGSKPAGSRDLEAGWSPDGGRLVVRNSTDCGGCTDLHVINSADGGGRVALVTGPGFDVAPRWSPSGQFIAYEGDRGERGIYVVPADGTGSEVKVSGTVGSWGGPTWSPDGSRLAFRAGLGDVYVVNADGTGLMHLGDVPATSGDIFWSPDGTKVAFHSGNADNWVDILVIAADGTGRRAVNYTKTRRADEFALSWR